ncbi:hypothetical protein [Nostoc sp. UHCC 0870]|uniref:hypothetical protein n=1 Tax=Nostoc sp. UHCC 0870 TaxID=2914041 RepID=UPI001EDEFBDB|nr:hypothetical protein [Nostoc sp. UHCC 0870]UKP00951.1 hypothetical protein L6494_27740 [Nostoc sp. UHCC 0870]
MAEDRAGDIRSGDDAAAWDAAMNCFKKNSYGYSFEEIIKKKNIHTSSSFKLQINASVNLL